MSRYFMCPDCGHRMRRAKDEYGYWDGETYICDYCGNEGEGYDEDALSPYDAALIWKSNGCDEDYMFGYTEEELREALGE